nr:MAG TPA: hypothetical protein [Microviridae sp.]
MVYQFFRSIFASNKCDMILAGILQIVITLFFGVLFYKLIRAIINYLNRH